MMYLKEKLLIKLQAKIAVEEVITELNLGDDIVFEVVEKYYNAPVQGTEDAPEGTDGFYAFTVKLSKGADNTLATAETGELKLNIIATAYTPAPP